MGAYKVAFSRNAERDLEKIVRYIARDNPEAAERIGQKLITRALTLSEESFVLVGSTLRERPEVRKLIEGKYLIIYRIFPGRVRILRFWHSARDPKRLNLGG